MLQLQGTKQLSSVHYCDFCGKKNTRKSTHVKHVILCEVLHSTKRERVCEEEESSDIPSRRQLYEIIQEMAMKYSIMEKKMEEMQKWVDKKKKKINIIEWLNVNKSLEINDNSYKDWVSRLIITEEHVRTLMEQNIVETIIKIFRDNLNCEREKEKENKYKNPIICFTQKANIFYICDENISNSNNITWKKQSNEEYILLIQKIHSLIWRELIEWKKLNKENIENNDKIADLYNKTIIKLAGLNFEYDSAALTKIKTQLYIYLKLDVKQFIEYEFEF